MKNGLGLLRSLLIYRRPGRQRALRRFYRVFVQPGDRVFDVGAHLGDRTTAFAALGARVLALEPQPRLFAWLQRLVGRHEAVTCLPLAVGSEPGTLELATSRTNPTVASLSPQWRARVVQAQPGFAGVNWDSRLRVEVTTLDHLIAHYGEPVFCKIDVEGFEPEVLAGLSRPLAALSVEFVAGALDQALACVERLEQLGAYRYQVVEGERREFFLAEWMDAEAIRAWLEAGAGGLASGDLYARRSVNGGDGGAKNHAHRLV
nr:FkbM family methyltransferase [Wenzhouxiangella limi]